MSNNKKVYTVGHSNHSIDNFINILKTNNIDVICDVRSEPYSKYNSQFNKNEITDRLNSNGIKYLFFGKELGARRIENELYTNGIVDFDKVANNNNFKSGINRIIDGINKKFNIALMCSEKDPVECHRNILVARNLQNQGIEVIHILADGSQQLNVDTEKNLIKKYNKKADFNIDQTELNFDSETDTVKVYSYEDKLNMAYKLASQDIAYRKEEEE